MSNENVEYSPELQEIIDQYPLPEGFVDKKYEALHQSVLNQLNECWAAQNTKVRPSIRENVVALGRKVRLRLLEHVELVGSAFGGGSPAFAMTRSADTQMPEAAKRSELVLRASSGITGQVIIRVDPESDLISFSLSVFDPNGEPLESFRYTLAAEGHGIAPGHERVLVTSRTVLIEGLHLAAYRVSLESPDGEHEVILGFDPV